MSYLLFYSSRCEFSKKFINILEKSGESTFFVKVCVDIIPSTGQRTIMIKKHNVTRVPTIIVNEQHLVGKSAFNWLKRQIDNREDSINTLNTRMNVKNADTRQVISEEIQGSLGSFNFQDSFIDDKTTAFEQLNGYSNADINPLEQAFVKNNEKNKETKNKDLPDELKSISISKDKLKSKQIENRYNELLKDREM